MLSHDYVFWCGDFNYRINMARQVSRGGWLSTGYNGLTNGIKICQNGKEQGSGKTQKLFLELSKLWGLE